jgi:hypothetical protein
MIGSLQRQLEIATGRVTATQGNGARTRKPARAKSGGLKKASGTTARGAARKKSAPKSTKKR